MKILFLSQVLPYPLDSGPKIRSYYVLRQLAKRHQVTLLSFIRSDDQPEAIAHLKNFCEVHTILIQRSRIRDLQELVTSFLSGESFVIRRDYFPEMEIKLLELLADGSYAAIHSDQLWMAQYALLAKRKYPQINLVLDEHNACFTIYQQLARGEKNYLKRIVFERESKMLYRFEQNAINNFDHIVTVTHTDRDILLNLVSEKSVADQESTNHKFSSFPICIDTGSVNPISEVANSSNILHLGTMFWLPNVEGVAWFISEVWPLVIQQSPEATFTIAGKNPPEYLKNLADSPTIVFTGYVTDPESYMNRANVFIVPLLSGSGMRVKILDAWAKGLPIVSTTIGAEGIQYVAGENILIAGTPEDFADAVLKVLREPFIAEKLRMNGRRWVESHYDWQSIYPAWDSIYP